MMDEDRISISVMNKEKSYGWIPILSGELIIKQKLFRNADIDNFKELFGPGSKILLSDNIFDQLFKLKHEVFYETKGLITCKECGEEVLYSSITVLNRKGEKQIEGDVWVHRNGFTRYEITYVNSDHSHPERVLHTLVRDVFHTHVHHSSDLPLPPIKAENEAEAKEKILEMFIYKFIEYKKISSKLSLKDAVENFSRARGEIVYANSAYELFKDSPYLPRSFKFFDKSFIRSSKFFDETFKILLEKTSYRLSLATNYIIMGSVMLAIHPIFHRIDLPQFQLFIHLFHFFGFLILILPFYFIVKSVRIRRKPLNHN